MATNYLQEMRDSITNQPAYRSSYGQRSMYDMTPIGGGGSDQRTNSAIQRRQMMELEEWNNRQKLYDPASWMSAFGSSTPTSAPSAYDAKLTALLDNPDSIANSGAYKFRIGQGNQAIQRSAAAKGMTGSGNVLAELLSYGQGEASQEYGNQVDRLTALRGQDQQLMAQREAANLQARNAFAQMAMQQAFKQADKVGSSRFY